MYQDQLNSKTEPRDPDPERAAVLDTLAQMAHERLYGTGDDKDAPRESDESYQLRVGKVLEGLRLSTGMENFGRPPEPDDGK